MKISLIDNLFKPFSVKCVDHVTTLYVLYVQVQHRQLGVTRLLGVKLLSVQTTVIYVHVQ